MKLRELVDEIVYKEIQIDAYGIDETMRYGCDCGCGGDSISEEAWDSYSERCFELQNLYKMLKVVSEKIGDDIPTTIVDNKKARSENLKAIAEMYDQEKKDIDSMPTRKLTEEERALLEERYGKFFKNNKEGE